MKHYTEWTNEDDLYMVDNYPTENAKYIAKHLGRTEQSVFTRAKILNLSKQREIFALYKGEELITTGTIPEVAKEMGIKESTVYYYTTPANLRKAKKGNTHNRRVAVRL